MLNRHVEELYELVPIGAKVIIAGHPLGEAYMMPRRLAKGDRGADVLLIQYQLRSSGFYKGRCHGIFDGGTESALKAFERNRGLPVDGVVGYRDYQELGLLE
jgi:peptidoglycan hydrolase-like protein with peptidoglycan-binding domain